MLNHHDIARRIPHHGSMCLLDRVVAWNPDSIQCEATSHRAADNPLRAHGRLGIACAIEYAAQAMAVHGSLLAEAHGAGAAAPRVGYLASVRNVQLHADRIDDVQGPLTVSAERLMGDANNIVYTFAVSSGAGALLSGRATVVLDAALAASIGAGSTA